MKLHRFDTENDLNEGLAHFEKLGIEVIDIKIVMFTMSSQVGGMAQQPVFYVWTKQGIILNK